MVSGIQSEYLHLQWTRSNMFLGHFYPPPPMPPTPAVGNNRPVNTTVPLEDYSMLNKETFYRRYGFPNRPVMLYNSGVESWPAWKQWTLEALVDKYGDASFRVSNLDGEDEPYFPVFFRDFYAYVKQNRDEDPLYLFDPLFADGHKELGHDYQVRVNVGHTLPNVVPKYFETDFFALLEGKDRPPYRWMLIGPQRTGASWHTDPSGTSAWNTLLSGHKRWAFQTIYVPTGWWHMVLNMDDTVAVTQNFADETNILQVKDSMLSEIEDKRQDKRWAALVEELSKAHPDLIPALTFDPKNELSTLLDVDDSVFESESQESTQLWQGRVIDAFSKTTRDRVIATDISPIKTGQNVCFLVKDKFIKFFTPLHDGLACFHAEVRANTCILNCKKTSAAPGALSNPRMIASGFLHEESTSVKWRWPFVVMDALKLSLSPEGDMMSDETQLVECGDYMPDNSDEYGTLLKPILQTLHYYHSLPVNLNVKEKKLIKSPQTHFQECLSNAARNHARWRLFPRHLLEQLPSFLPSSASLLFDPTRGDAVANLVHGDVNPSNVLGLLHYNSTDLPSSHGQHEEETSHHYPPYPSAPLLPMSIPAPPTFEPTAVIDFGDAQFSSDPLVDFVSVYVTVLNCRRDLKDMLTLLREAWCASFGDIPDQAQDQDDYSRMLARRCLWHVLVWPSEGLGLHLARCVPEIGEMATWQEVEEAIFGWWKE
ncbi:hypothetical protein BG004_006288 [Podila humilis]|nr:hypothetical protein BG004_006288 [Podila humilis]